MTVAVALTDLAVTTLDEHLALLIDGDVPRTVNANAPKFEKVRLLKSARALALQ